MIDTINYRNYSIEIHADDCPDNPWKSWDGNPPYFGKAGHALDTDCAPDVYEITDLIPRSQWAGLAVLAYYGPANTSFTLRVPEFLQDVRSYELRTWDDQKQHMLDMLDMDCIETLEQLCGLAGLECYAGTSFGHSQSDWTDLLFVATPAWLAETGIATCHVDKALQHAYDLWSAWAWGDVFGYIVTSPEGDEVASCWGFYGDNNETSGLLDSAKEEIEANIEADRKERLARLKTLIRERVPLPLRPALLASFS